jgi:hypothetical protein
MMKHALYLMMLTGSLAFGQATNSNSNANSQAAADASKKQEALEARVKELESPGHNRFWQGNMNGGEIMVAVDRIGSISKTQYLLDGGIIVTEVVIDTHGGQSLTRIYHLAPATDGTSSNAAAKIVDRAKELLDNTAARAGTKAHEMVQKTYPATTHAHTVEFRVMHLEDLDALYSSLKATWVTGKGRTFSIK